MICMQLLLLAIGAVPRPIGTARSRPMGPTSSRKAAFYGQELNHTTWKLCKMNLAGRLGGHTSWVVPEVVSE